MRIGITGLLCAAILILLVGCARMVVDRSYDASGIISERGEVTALLGSKVVGDFNMTRRDQRSATSWIDESAGAKAELSNEAVALQTIAAMLKLMETYMAAKATGAPPVP